MRLGWKWRGPHLTIWNVLDVSCSHWLSHGVRFNWPPACYSRSNLPLKAVWSSAEQQNTPGGWKWWLSNQSGRRWNAVCEHVGCLRPESKDMWVVQSCANCTKSMPLWSRGVCWGDTRRRRRPWWRMHTHTFTQRPVGEIRDFMQLLTDCESPACSLTGYTLFLHFTFFMHPLLLPSLPPSLVSFLHHTRSSLTFLVGRSLALSAGSSALFACSVNSFADKFSKNAERSPLECWECDSWIPLSFPSASPTQWMSKNQNMEVHSWAGEATASHTSSFYGPWRYQSWCCSFPATVFYSLYRSGGVGRRWRKGRGQKLNRLTWLY